MGALVVLLPNQVPPAVDPQGSVQLLCRDLRTGAGGLSSREAERRLVGYGRNELISRGKRRWPHDLLAQFTHPLAALLAVAAVLAVATGSSVLGIAIAVVIVLNAAFAFVEELQAATGHRMLIEARLLVPGDVVFIPLARFRP